MPGVMINEIQLSSLCLTKAGTRSEEQNQGRAKRAEGCLDFVRSGAYIYLSSKGSEVTFF
jgi:hypothetical protein